MTARQTAAKKRVRKKRNRKGTVKVKAKPNGAPVEVSIDDEAIRFKLEALQLKLDGLRKEIAEETAKEFQVKCDQAIMRKLRNNSTFAKMNDEFQLLLNETVEALSPGEGYIAKNLDTGEGVITYVSREAEAS